MSTLLPSSDVFKMGIYTFMVGALSFVVAFAWNSAIEDTISRYVGPRSQLWLRSLYAIVLTVVIVVGIYILSRVLGQEVRFK